jgi:antitoxin (DNA-binding transcriptional repressor) of toxin-antitoxin stability system
LQGEAVGAYSVAEVKAHLSAVLEAVERGEQVIITKRGKPVARILRETQGGEEGVDWAKVDAFRASLRQKKAGAAKQRASASSVAALRKRDRY